MQRVSWMIVAILVGVISVLAGAARAQEPAGGEPTSDGPDAAPVASGPVFTEQASVTHHEVTIAGAPVAYTATAGYMPLPDYGGKTKANVFFVAYTRDGVEDLSARPITFAFNGGPGSSSVWLHMGALGPKRVLFDPEGMPLPPPYRAADNEFSWLDMTDLVFIDPVSTGYSRAVEGEDPSQYHGVQEDVRAVAEFIRLYTTRMERWQSPKFLAGESYGTTRAAGLAGYLQDTYGLYLNGLVLVSMILDFGTTDFATNNDTPCWLFLPTYTATAWYHKRLAPELQADLRRTLAEVEAWASTDYLVALAKGDRLTPQERAEVIDRLSRYTGLSREYVDRSNLRIRIFNFTKELLRDQGRTVGRLDSRYQGIDRDGAGASTEFDPSYAAILGPYTATLMDYIRRDLAYDNDLVYEILTGRVHPWSFANAQNEYLDVAETLRGAMSRNRDLRVLVASGYYDLATPYFASEHTIAHMGLDPSIRGHISTVYYESGHMMYVREADLRKLKQDVADFYSRTLAR